MPKRHGAKSNAALFNEPAPTNLLRVLVSIKVILAVHSSLRRCYDCRVCRPEQATLYPEEIVSSQLAIRSKAP